MAWERGLLLYYNHTPIAVTINNYYYDYIPTTLIWQSKLAVIIVESIVTKTHPSWPGYMHNN